jgi:hypothetical protein
MARFNRDNRNDENKKFFRGLEIGSKVVHVWDHTARGTVTDIQIPLVYVKFNNDNKIRFMDRDELTLIEEKRREEFVPFSPEEEEGTW